LSTILQNAAIPPGENATFLPLLRRLLPVIGGRARQLARGDRLLQEELERAGALGVYEAAQKFDPTRGIPIAKFAVKYAIHRIASQMRAEWVLQRQSEDPSFQHDCLDGGKTGLQEDCDAFLTRRAVDAVASDNALEFLIGRERRAAVRKYVDGLPPRLRTIGHAHYLRGLPQAQIARELHLSRTAVSKSIKKIVCLGANCSELLAHETAA
jgi:RNA polymerase sigma factor (sigma-70 family)